MKYLKAWKEEFKDPLVVISWFLFRPYRFRKAWGKILYELHNEENVKFPRFLRAMIQFLISLPKYYTEILVFEFLFVITYIAYLFSFYDISHILNSFSYNLDIPLNGSILMVAILLLFAWYLIAEIFTGTLLKNISIGLEASLMTYLGMLIFFGVIIFIIFMFKHSLVGLKVLIVIWGSIFLVFYVRIFEWIIWIIGIFIGNIISWKSPMSKYNGHIVLPLIGDDKLLYRKLIRDFWEGLDEGFEISFNPFQRWIFQRALKTYLLKFTPSQLQKFYYDLRLRFSREELLIESVIPALNKENILKEIPRFQAMLILLSSRKPCDFKNTNKNPFYFNPEVPEYLSTRISYFLFNKRDSLVKDLSTAYHAMIFENKTPEDYLFVFDRAQKQGDVFADELFWTYQTIGESLKVSNLDELIALIPKLEKFKEFNNPLQPSVLTAFNYLYDIAIIVRNITRLLEISYQQVAINIFEKIRKLRRFVENNLPEPERRYFIQISNSWENLLSDIFKVQAEG